VEFKTVVVCSKCEQPIVSGEGFGFVCFKIPGMEGYNFFQDPVAGTAGKLTCRNASDVVHIRKDEVNQRAKSQRIRFQN
jgi:hypothetical protein